VGFRSSPKALTFTIKSLERPEGRKYFDVKYHWPLREGKLKPHEIIKTYL
jgi:hypothetical protein